MDKTEEKTVEIPSTPNEDELSENSSNSKKRVVVAVVVAVVVIAAIAAGAFYLATKVGTISTQVNAEGWNKDTSTQVELCIYQGDVKEAILDEDTSNDPQPYKTVMMDANTKWDLTDITERGTYTLSIKATPVLEDGTLFKIPDPQVVELAGDGVQVTFDLEKLDLSTASAEEVEAATKAAEEAAKATGNEDALSKATAATKKATEKAPATSHKNNATSNSGGSSSGNSSAGSGSSGGSSSSGSSSGGSSQGHTHNWVDQTQYTTKPVYTEKIQCSCGATFSSVGAWTAHNKAIVADDPEAGHSYSPIKVQTGTERVPVSGTQYEKCSICGATRQGLDVVYVYKTYTYTTFIHIAAGKKLLPAAINTQHFDKRKKQ